MSEKQRHRSLHDAYGVDAPRALSAIMLDAAETVSIPSRFQAKTSPRPGCVIVMDTDTGRSVEVALHAYRTVREVLAALFE